MSEQKDIWDKAEVIGKLLVPVVVGISVWLWNTERNEHQRASTMTQIAIGVLSSKSDDGDISALRSWAIEVLQNPANPPTLSEQAALQLKMGPIFWGIPSDKIKFFGISGGDGGTASGSDSGCSGVDCNAGLISK